MDFTFDDEQQLLRTGLTRFLATRYDLEKSRAAVTSGAGWQPEIWRAFAQELGILGALVPEDCGGIGGGPVEMMLICEALGHAPGRPARLLVRHAAGHRLVPVRSIARFAAEHGLVFAHTATGAFATDYTLGELEQRMSGSFIRVSRADLVSLAHVTGIVSNGDGSATLTLGEAGEVRVSRRRAAAVREALTR